MANTNVFVQIFFHEVANTKIYVQRNFLVVHILIVIVPIFFE